MIVIFLGYAELENTFREVTVCEARLEFVARACVRAQSKEGY